MTPKLAHSVSRTPPPLTASSQTIPNHWGHNPWNHQQSFESYVLLELLHIVVEYCSNSIKWHFSLTCSLEKTPNWLYCLNNTSALEILMHSFWRHCPISNAIAPLRMPSIHYWHFRQISDDILPFSYYYPFKDTFVKFLTLSSDFG